MRLEVYNAIGERVTHALVVPDGMPAEGIEASFNHRHFRRGSTSTA